MRNPTTIDFSLIIPSRDRNHRLKACLHSFYSKATHPEALEAIILRDFDDKEATDFSEYLPTGFQGHVVFGHQSTRMIRDYNNYGGQCATGKYIWMLNDDNEMTTEGWDVELKDSIEEFLTERLDRVAYVHVDDNTHTAEWRYSWGCTCPILTVEAVEAMNGIMPAEIEMWGADIFLYMIFKQLKYARILDKVNDIKVLHHSVHNHTATGDASYERAKRVSHKMQLTTDEIYHYVSRLNSYIEHHNNARPKFGGP